MVHDSFDDVAFHRGPSRDRLMFADECGLSERLVRVEFQKPTHQVNGTLEWNTCQDPIQWLPFKRQVHFVETIVFFLTENVCSFNDCVLDWCIKTDSLLFYDMVAISAAGSSCSLLMCDGFYENFVKL